MKTCTKCKRDLPLSAFRKDRTKRDGLCSWCTSCSVAANRKNRALDPQRYQAILRSWRERNPDYSVDYYRQHREYWEQRRRERPAARISLPLVRNDGKGLE